MACGALLGGKKSESKNFADTVRITLLRNPKRRTPVFAGKIINGNYPNGLKRKTNSLTNTVLRGFQIRVLPLACNRGTVTNQSVKHFSEGIVDGGSYTSRPNAFKM